MGIKILFFSFFNLLIAAFVLLFPNSSLAATCTSANIRFASSSNTIYVTGPVDCSLSDIKTIKPLSPLDLIDSSKRIWLLRANLKLEQGARLPLHGSAIGGDVNELRLRSNNVSAANSTIWIRAQWGTIDIANTKITSWDETANAPDTEYATYKRSYIHVRSFLEVDGVTARESRMDIKNSDVGYLGFYAAESYGLTWKVSGTTAGIFDKVNVLGDIINSRIHHNYFGAYTYGAYGMRWQNNEIDNNIQYGLDPHDDSDSLLIEGNYSHDNGNHGIICSQRCDHLVIRNNVSANNNGNGIMLHRNANDSLIENNQVLDNLDAGIAIFDSHKNTIRNNISLRNNHGIRFSVASSENLIDQNEFGNNKLHGIYFYKGSDAPTSGDGRPKQNRFTSNNIHDNKDYSLKLKEGDSNTFENNNFSSNAREIYIYDANNNVFRANSLIGANDFYHARFKSISTIENTDAMNVKIGDSDSSVEIKDTRNYILQNDKNIKTTAEPSFTRILLTRAQIASLVSFKRLSFIVIPTFSAFVNPITWQTTSPFNKKWIESTSASSSASHGVGDLKPSVSYDILVDSALLNSYVSGVDGKISFIYSGFNGSAQTFEIKESIATMSAGLSQ